MTVFDVLTMVGGLCLFLFGMNIMGDGLERRGRRSLPVRRKYALSVSFADSGIKVCLPPASI